MTLKTRLLAAGSALLLSAGAAIAAPAVAQTDLNMRSGPGPQYGVVATIPDGATVDVGGCTGSWCQVNFDGTSGFASASYLSSTGGGGQSVGVVVQPGYDNYAYDDDSYYGYGYGPSVGIYAGSGYRGGYRQGWNGRAGWNGGRNAGNWNGGRNGVNWQGGQGRVGANNFNRGGNFANRGGNFGAGRMGGAQMSAPAGLRSGGAGGGGMRGGGAQVGGSAQPGGGAAMGVGRGVR